MSVSTYKPLCDKNWIYLCVGANSWLLRHYIYNKNNKLIRVVSGGTWNDKVLLAFNDFIYGRDGELDEIISDHETIWKRKTKKS